MFCKAPVPRRLVSLALLIALLGLSTAGCGKKGIPLPPLRNVPATTTDLALSQQGSQVMLELAYPATTVGGMVLGGIDSVEIYQLTKPAAEGVPAPTAEAQELETSGKLLMTLRGTELSSAIVGDRLQFRLPVADALPEEPTAQIYAVRTSKGPELSAFSNRVTLVPQAPPEAPDNVKITAKAAGVEISWDSVPADGFDIFRRFATERGYGEPVARVKGDETKFFDRQVKYGERYIYTVRTVSGTISSEPAGDYEVDYDDRFPPRLPQNFVALPEQGSVRLRWDPSPDPDATGYLIFRRDTGQRDFFQVTPNPIPGTEYQDRGLASGLTFYYRIQVVDGPGNQSRRSDPISVTTR